MNTQGAEVFIPVHDVFGGQTSLNAANNPNLFKEAYNSAVDFPNRIAKTVDVCRDTGGTRLRTWRKDWAQVIPSVNGEYPVRDVSFWLWQRFISDGGEHYGPLEQAQVTALLATGFDLGYLVDPTNPDVVYSAQATEAEPVASVVAANEAAVMDLDSPVNATRREANRRVGLAINFIGMTPFMFATSGGSAPVTVPNVVGLGQTDAEAAVIDAGLRLGVVTTESSDAVPAGGVIEQIPKGGDLVNPGSAVDLLVSAGPTPVQVPDVVGLSQGAAEQDILAANLTVGVVGTANSATVPAGDVISQSPSAGTSVAPGSPVDLVVSIGLLPDQPPMVRIDSPADGAVYDEGTQIGFSAAASDPEDGDLTADLVWTSDLDGRIGTGGSFGTNLSLGSHTISVSVIDSNGQSDSDAIQVSVIPAAEAGNLKCEKFEYKEEKRQLRVEVKSSDKTGSRMLTAVLDLDGDGVFERSHGVIPIKPGSRDTYRRIDDPFVERSLTASSSIKVMSDLGGVCTRRVKVD